MKVGRCPTLAAYWPEETEMKPIMPAVAIAILVSATTLTSAEPPQSDLGTPRSVQLQHEQLVSRLESIAKRGGPTGMAAGKAATFLKAHYAKEEEFVLPPLGLLSTILKNPSPADLDRAIAMAERTQAALDELLADHLQITTMMNDLIEAGSREHDESLTRLARRVAAQSLNDIEVVQPTTILIGEYIRANLRKGK
jgi:hypothetical protein